MRLDHWKIHGSLFALASLAASGVGCGGPAPTTLRATSDGGDPVPPVFGAPSSLPATPSAAPDAGSASSDASTCVPQSGPDVPDDAFTDTNCDGIDGDASRAVFVAPSGSDSADGSLARPVKTFATAIRLAAAAGKDVYACNGTYAEAVTLTAKGVSLYGGYDCNDGWRRVEDVFVLAPPAGVPLTVRGVASAVIDHARLQAADAVDPGGSSVASLVVDSTVTFHRTIAQAGAGADGAAGRVTPAATTPAPAGGEGQSWQDVTCTLPCTAVANGGVATASCGAGGAAGVGASGGNGNATTWNPASAGGPPGVGGATTATGGLPGGVGATGADGVAASAGFGEVTADGYAPANAGTDGAAGGPGGGGGGGPGGSWVLNSFGGRDTPCVPAFEVGGGGGAGGCGGAGGAGGGGGGGGGASIALLSFASTVSLTGCTLTTSAGGNGGLPGVGALGQPGGAGGQGGAGLAQGSDGVCLPLNERVYDGDGEAGGPGGAGGKGGAGGPGGGGPSVGIVSVGPVASTDAATIFNIGAGGRGAVSLDGARDGANGVSAPTLDLDAPDAGPDASR